MTGKNSVVLPEQVVMWLLRAWNRFRNSNSASWCNQMRQGSRIYMLESKNNRAGKFLQLLKIKGGKRVFVVFPARWNKWGWTKMFEFIAELVGSGSIKPMAQLKQLSFQPLDFEAHVIFPPPLPPKCWFIGETACFQWGFIGEPACFLC